MDYLKTSRNIHKELERGADKGNGLVFPFALESTEYGEILSTIYYGLKKRELFAAMAMQGLLSNTSIAESASIIDDYAKAAVSQADALIEALYGPQSDQGQSES